jgi:hypothetical protein
MQASAQPLKRPTLRRSHTSRSHNSLEDLQRHGAAAVIQRRWRARRAERARDALAISVVAGLILAGDVSDAAGLLELAIYSGPEEALRGAASALVRWCMLHAAAGHVVAMEPFATSLAAGAATGWLMHIGGLSTPSRVSREIALGAAREVATSVAPSAALAAAVLATPALDSAGKWLRGAARRALGAHALAALAAADIVAAVGVEAALKSFGMDAI